MGLNYIIYTISIVADPHHSDKDPDPAFHFDADPDPNFYSDADPEHWLYLGCSSIEITSGSAYGFATFPHIPYSVSLVA